MRKILCNNDVQKQEKEKFLTNLKAAFFDDPEDGKLRIEDPLSAFEKTDTYKSTSEEFKSQLKALLGYEYENRQDAENGLESLIRCFESQKEPNLVIKGSATGKECKVFIDDNRKDRKIPNTYKGVLSFRISEKYSVKIYCIFSVIFAALSAIIVIGIAKPKLGKLDTLSLISYITVFFSLIMAIKMFLSTKIAKKIKKLYSFEGYFSIGIMLTALFLGYLCVHQNTNKVFRTILKIVSVIPVGTFLEMLINKKG